MRLRRHLLVLAMPLLAAFASSAGFAQPLLRVDASGTVAAPTTGYGGPNRRLELLVPENEIAARLEAWRKDQGTAHFTRGYCRLYVEHVTQADRGCDFNFLADGSSTRVERESH